MIIASLIYALKAPVYRILILSLVIALAVHSNLQSGIDFRKDWESQKDFFWQLYWRAPSLMPNTFIISETEIFKYESNHIDLGPALNMLYSKQNTTTPSYWAFSTSYLNASDHITSEDLLQGVVISQSVRTLRFTAPSQNGLPIVYLPDGSQCLWIITPLDISYPFGSSDASILSSISAPNRILSDPKYITSPNPIIFGNEPLHDWCYFFQKASLARQNEDWQDVSHLGDEAIANGYQPSNPYEWIPFLEGYIHTKNWELTRTINNEILTSDENLLLSICQAWARALDTTNLTKNEQGLVTSQLNEIGCNTP